MPPTRMSSSCSRSSLSAFHCAFARNRSRGVHILPNVLTIPSQSCSAAKFDDRISNVQRKCDHSGFLESAHRKCYGPVEKGKYPKISRFP